MRFVKLTLIGLIGLAFSLPVFASEPHKVISLFNGKDLTGWKGVEGFWTVEDGAITGRTTADNKVKKTTFLVWEGGQPEDFILNFKYRLLDENGEGKGYSNSGVQYRSRIIDESYFVVAGYQADMELGDQWNAVAYDAKGRRLLANRGQKVIVEDGEDPKKPKITLVEQMAKSEEIQAAIKPGEWNECKIVAKGNVLEQWFNGKLATQVTDKGSKAPKDGVIAIQLHQGKPMTAQFKDLLLVTE